MMPAASRLYTMFGRVLAMEKDSAAPAVTPNTATRSAERTKPRTRETRVPDAIRTEDLSRVCCLGARTWSSGSLTSSLTCFLPAQRASPATSDRSNKSKHE